MNVWLKLIGSWKKPLSHPDYSGKWEEEYIGFREKKKLSIRSGDYMFFYAPGGSKKFLPLPRQLVIHKLTLITTPKRKEAAIGL